MSSMVARVRGPVKRELRKLRQETVDKGLAARLAITHLDARKTMTNQDSSLRGGHDLGQK